MSLQILDPAQYPGWDEILLSTPHYSFFHSSEWARVLSESYGFKPKYFVDIHEGKFLVLIPIMEVNSFLTGKRGVSLPFTDYCDPILNGNSQLNDLFKDIVTNGKRSGWRYLELRSRSNFFNLNPISTIYLGHILDLSEKVDQIFSKFRDSTKRNIKKARKQGVELKIENTIDSVKEFYKLNCITRKRHGLPPQPFIFFKKIFEHIISKDMGLIVLAFLNVKPIAGAVYFHFGDTAIYKYGASDFKYQNLRANNLVMWGAIEWYSQKGYKRLCLGRTEPQNFGLIQFKSGWGAKEYKLYYYRYSIKKENFLLLNYNETGFHNKIFRCIPLFLLVKLGNILYKDFA
ncbi:MAG: GNAT family N-acetyltransferase [candidate division WOR-3 bacterium]